MQMVVSPRTPKATTTVSVVVTPAIKTLFEGMRMEGDGGFQSLGRELVRRLERGDAVLRFSSDEFRRILNYSTNYGNGGFQTRLRVIIATWAVQHFAELLPCLK